MARRRFTERQVIETLIRTGHEIRDYRTKELITLETVKELEREHVTPIKLGGADDPTNCAYSRAENHKLQTNGKPHTSYGSDKHAIAKVDRITGVTGNGPKKRIQSRGFQKRPEGHEYNWGKRPRPNYTPRDKMVNGQ